MPHDAPATGAANPPVMPSTAAVVALEALRLELGGDVLQLGPGLDVGRLGKDYALQSPAGAAPLAIARPGEVAQVAQILHCCNAHRIPVVPQGGNTGLVGGSVPLEDEVVLSTVRLSSLGPVDETERLLQRCGSLGSLLAPGGIVGDDDVAPAGERPEAVGQGVPRAPPHHHRLTHRDGAEVGHVLREPPGNRALAADHAAPGDGGDELDLHTATGARIAGWWK